MSLQAGTSFGPYEIIAPLGAGGMGEVYRARDTRLGRDVAIKTLPESLATDAEHLARFRREAETLAALNHPNIATIYGLERREGQEGKDQVTTFIVMELVEGPTLAERLSYVASGFSRTTTASASAVGPLKGGPHIRNGLPLDEALPLAQQLALALEAAHERGIIHRDLKPANIKLTADGSLKLLDFGLAKALEPGAGGAGGAGGFSASPTISVMATQAGVLLGTAAYMSPEQVRGTGVDKRADIWAFGVVHGRWAGVDGGRCDLATSLRGEPTAGHRWNGSMGARDLDVGRLMTRAFDVAADGRILMAADPSIDNTSDLTTVRVTLHFADDARRRLAPAKP